MSKHVNSTVRPDPAPAVAVAVKVKVPVGECLGRMVICPDCGRPAEVASARAAKHAGQVVSSIFWARLNCTGACGAKLQKIGVLVEPIEAGPPGPRQMLLAEAVGRFVACPRCGGKARAAWDSLLAHHVDCPVCRPKSEAPETVVEVMG